MMERILQIVRRLMGMPDYAGYLRHLRSCHPERPVPSEREFFREWLEARYNGVSRCC